MEKVVINNTSNDLYDIVRYKARAIIRNEDNKIYVTNMNDSFNLPGGTFEEKEDPDTAIMRELNEELGLTNIKPIPFKEFHFYHDDFPLYDGKSRNKSLNIVYVYLLHINSWDIGKSNFTEYELDHNYKVECHTIEEVIELLKLRNDNIWKPYTDKELTIILKEYKMEVEDI